MQLRQITIVVGLIRNDKGEILLGRRNQPDLPDEHNRWEFPGGNIEFGENPEEALKREVMEETGLVVKIVKLLPKAFSNIWRRSESTNQVIILPYECKYLSGTPKPGDNEVSELKFFKPEQIDYSKCLPKTDEMITLLLNS